MGKSTNWPARFAEMMDLVGLSDEDRQLIKDSGNLIMAQARGLNDYVYDELLRHPQSRKFFVTANDEPDEKRIEANKQTMISWLRATVTAPWRRPSWTTATTSGDWPDWLMPRTTARSSRGATP